MNENKDLINLCRLNLLEENVEKSPAPKKDRDDTLKMIDFKRRNLVLKIIADSK